MAAWPVTTQAIWAIARSSKFKLHALLGQHVAALVLDHSIQIQPGDSLSPMRA